MRRAITALHALSRGKQNPLYSPRMCPHLAPVGLAPAVMLPADEFTFVDVVFSLCPSLLKNDQP